MLCPELKDCPEIPSLTLRQALQLHLYATQTELTTVQPLHVHVPCLLHSSVHVHITKYDYVII